MQQRWYCALRSTSKKNPFFHQIGFWLGGLQIQPALVQIFAITRNISYHFASHCFFLSLNFHEMRVLRKLNIHVGPSSLELLEQYSARRMEVRKLIMIPAYPITNDSETEKSTFLTFRDTFCDCLDLEYEIENPLEVSHVVFQQCLKFLLKIFQNSGGNRFRRINYLN